MSALCQNCVEYDLVLHYMVGSYISHAVPMAYVCTLLVVAYVQIIT